MAAGGREQPYDVEGVLRAAQRVMSDQGWRMPPMPDDEGAPESEPVEEEP